MQVVEKDCYVDGFKDFRCLPFTLIIGDMIQYDLRILFQMGWEKTHQLDWVNSYHLRREASCLLRFLLVVTLPKTSSSPLKAMVVRKPFFSLRKPIFRGKLLFSG